MLEDEYEKTKHYIQLHTSGRHHDLALRNFAMDTRFLIGIRITGSIPEKVAKNIGHLDIVFSVEMQYNYDGRGYFPSGILLPLRPPSLKTPHMTHFSR
jgi:hypothetical protein